MVEQELTNLLRVLFVQLRDVRASRIAGMYDYSPTEVQRATGLHRYVPFRRALVEGVLAERIQRE